MTQLTPLEKFTVPWGQQDIELQQIDFDGGGMSMLRTRIREKTRFTIFDIDPLTAKHWGQALLRWAHAQPEPHSAQASPSNDLPNERGV
jgi:hypothetical protein